MVRNPLRFFPVFRATVNLTVPLPVPLPPLVMPIHDSCEFADHAQPLAVDTLKAPVPPASPTFTSFGETE